MRLSSPAAWSLATSLVSLAAAADGARGGVVEVDIMFPRNETYAPTNDTLPVLFAIQNAAVGQPLNFNIWFGLYDQSASAWWDDPIVWSFHPVKWANLSDTEPYFLFMEWSQSQEIRRDEGRYRLAWSVSWQSCVEDSFTNPRPLGRGVLSNSSYRYVDFAVEHGAQPMDLVAATADDKPCPAEFGVAINVTSQTVAVPPAQHSGWSGTGDVCAVVASAKPTANPCPVKVNSALVASMSASRYPRTCADHPASCGLSDASRPLAVAGATGLAVTVGALGFFLLWI